MDYLIASTNDSLYTKLVVTVRDDQLIGARLYYTLVGNGILYISNDNTEWKMVQRLSLELSVSSIFFNIKTKICQKTWIIWQRRYYHLH